MAQATCRPVLCEDVEQLRAVGERMWEEWQATFDWLADK